MSAPFGSDPWLDARLRNVPLPPGMLARLNELAKEPTDESQLAGAASTANGPKLYMPNQPIPVGSHLSDEQLDAVLVDVPLPSGLRQRLERIAREERRRIGGRQLVIAASLLVAVGIAYLGRSTFWADPPNQKVSDEPIAKVERHRKSKPATDRAAKVPANEPLVVTQETEVNPLIDLPSIDDLRWELMKQANSQIDLLDQVVSPSPSDLPPERPSKESVFASEGVLDTLPELELVEVAPSPRGIAPSVTPGFDLRFVAKYGQNPFVVPAAHKNLQSLSVPLVTSSASYQNAWQSLANRKLPAVDEVRVEEFLAAVDYDFPSASPGTLALRAAAGPSPFAEPGMRLLQVAVQAGPLVSQNRPGTLLTVVVDTSTSMKRKGRLAMIRRALAEVTSQLTSADRLSLVGTGGDTKLLIDAAGPDQRSRIISAIQSLEPARVTNVGAALEAAYLAALDQQPAEGESRCAVLITNGLAELGDETLGRIEGLVADAAAKGITLHIMQAGHIQTERDQQSQTRIATAGRGEVVMLSNGDAAKFALLEVLTGRHQVVARDASVRIAFNPKSVAAYRLLGHETVTLVGTSAAPTAVNLRAGEVATALVELRLNPQGGDEVATVELTWQDATSGEQRSAKQRISRLQFAKSFAESPLALQTAAIVGHTAEVLRGSYFTPGSKSLAPVLDLATQASPMVVDRSSMRVFLSFVDQAEKVRVRGTK